MTDSRGKVYAKIGPLADWPTFSTDTAIGVIFSVMLSLAMLALAQIALAGTEPTVEHVQDLVEEVLLASPFKRTAKAYILYREQHARIRELARQAGLDLIDRYLERLDWQVRANSNMAYSLQGLNNYVASEVSKIYWLNKLYPAEAREAHLAGALSIHGVSLLLLASSF